MALKSLRVDAKFRFLSQHIISIARARWARWPFCKTSAKALDSLQTRMVALLMDAKLMPLEPYDQFCARRLRQAGTLCNKYGRFSSFWALGVCKWHAHVKREHDPGSWCNDMLLHRQISFIDQMRASFSYRGSSRTNTRCRIGGISQRWEQGFKEADELRKPNPLIVKVISQIDNMPVTRTALLERLEAIIQQIES